MPDFFQGKFSNEQTQALLAPINPRRVFTTQGQSYVPYFEVTAHLIRIFGFGNFAVEVLESPLVFESQRTNADGTLIPGKWDVCYSAKVRLTIMDAAHNVVTTFENVSCGDAQNQARHEAHDLALKSAVSTATKRCAINLGDQFGLSLYNKGKKEAIVLGSKVLPKDYAAWLTEQGGQVGDSVDPSEGVAQVESDGIDEIETAATPAVSEEEAAATLASSLGARPVEGPKS